MSDRLYTPRWRDDQLSNTLGHLADRNHAPVIQQCYYSYKYQGMRDRHISIACPVSL